MIRFSNSNRLIPTQYLIGKFNFPLDMVIEGFIFQPSQMVDYFLRLSAFCHFYMTYTHQGCEGAIA